MKTETSVEARLATLDLFSGIGGFSLGLERTGRFETVRSVYRSVGRGPACPD